MCTTLAARMCYGVAESSELRLGKYFMILTSPYRCIQTSTRVLPGPMNRTVGENLGALLLLVFTLGKHSQATLLRRGLPVESQ